MRDRETTYESEQRVDRVRTRKIKQEKQGVSQRKRAGSTLAAGRQTEHESEGYHNE